MQRKEIQTLVSSEIEVDVAVVGAGAAGMTTALVAAQEGLQVLVLEKTSSVGGSCAYSAGVVWVPNNHWAQQAGMTDSREMALTYLRTLIGKRMDEEKIATYLDRAPEVFEYLDRHSEVTFVPRSHTPDYWSELDGAILRGRALAAVDFDARTLGNAFTFLRRPPDEFMVLGGMMVTAADAENLLRRFESWSAFKASMQLVLRYLKDRLSYPRGTRLVMGNALAARLFKGLLDRQVPIWRDTPVNSLIMEAGRIVGLRASRNGEPVAVRARRGVVLASGGFPHNEEMRRELMPHGAPDHSAAPEGITGDGLRMGQAVGAVMGQQPETSAFWSPTSAVRRTCGKIFNFPHLVMDRSKPGVIAVNAAGNRFVNEASNYHDFGRAMLKQQETTGSSRAYLICDQAFLDRYALGVVYPGVVIRRRMLRNGYLLRADSIAALAQQLHVPSDVLRQTLERYNQDARQGRDLEFGKGDTEYNRYLGDPKHQPNPCLAPIERAPFYALAINPGDIGTTYGLATDTNGQVLDANGRAVAGLYACGNDMNTIMGGEYPGAGITLGPALTFGYLAAKALAEAEEAQ